MYWERNDERWAQQGGGTSGEQLKRNYNGVCNSQLTNTVHKSLHCRNSVMMYKKKSEIFSNYWRSKKLMF